ncbi:hypothetical protein [Cerasicoccus fimbriatus]|nr:hypothetical protein [Cerasicoccus sp. TK19100]
MTEAELLTLIAEQQVDQIELLVQLFASSIAANIAVITAIFWQHRDS